MNGISKETFEAANEKTKLSILFDYQKGTHSNIESILSLLQKHPLDCEKRFKKLEHRKLLDTVLSGGLGFVGGFSAMAAKLKFWG
jgi:hypothetical protein